MPNEADKQRKNTFKDFFTKSNTKSSLMSTENNLKSDHLLHMDAGGHISPPISFKKELQSQINTNLSSISFFDISKEDATKFHDHAAQLATSDDVISELSNKLGVPKENETENEFVKRAKTILFDILQQKLIK